MVRILCPNSVLQKKKNYAMIIMAGWPCIVATNWTKNTYIRTAVAIITHTRNDKVLKKGAVFVGPNGKLKKICNYFLNGSGSHET